MINKGIPEWWNGLDQDYFNEYLADPDDEIDELVKNHLADTCCEVKGDGKFDKKTNKFS